MHSPVSVADNNIWKWFLWGLAAPESLNSTSFRVNNDTNVRLSKHQLIKCGSDQLLLLMCIHTPALQTAAEKNPN